MEKLTLQLLVNNWNKTKKEEKKRRATYCELTSIRFPFFNYAKRRQTKLKLAQGSRCELLIWERNANAQLSFGWLDELS